MSSNTKYLLRGATIGLVVVFLILLISNIPKTKHNLTAEEVAVRDQQATEQQAEMNRSKAEKASEKKKQKLKETLTHRYPWFVKIKEREIDGLPLTTHPSFRDGTVKLVDSDVNIADYPEQGWPVWIEKVTSASSVIVSYEAYRGNAERVITFAHLGIAGLDGSTLNECQRDAALQYMQTNLEQHLFWIGHDYEYEHRMATKNKETQTILPLSAPLIQIEEGIDSEVTRASKQEGAEFADVAAGLITLGYGKMNEGGFVTDRKTLKELQELAQVKKAGFWEACPK